ncbi:MBL fold metallo-hydrolase [Pseudoalteromonas sp. MMG010]|uniref:MBL fold metallo-hydrolase n=1 Tax=Pseudoalteromonas sp. MMG010 TaxID=2822685 RepID=UPI001B3A0A6A|nr:MBL fold metallo-hydrolase [Pseudoalteromonas sp. MMG010]MBQ4834395.1 MBL fold metallo-hydrolase [Pseudoalteromonas sp. MMG010]
MTPQYIMCILVILLSACSSSNHVELIAGKDTLTIKHKAGVREGRFKNIYPKIAQYPTTCEHDCYPSHPDVLCQSPAENCIYQGINESLNLDTGFTIRWLGHASFYITAPNGESILFDPVKEQFDSPVDLAFKLTGGMYRKPGAWPSKLQLDSLNGIMYSHIHYDHFNKNDIKNIGNAPRYLVPQGMADNFPNGGFNISEMAWYAKTQINSLTVHALPAHHFSSRVVVPFIYEDNEKDAWNAWLLEQNGKTLFFAGDTGYSQHFKDINKKYGAIDICLMPIASYHHEQNAKWYRYVHTTPEDALNGAKELNCKVMIPWGYGNSSWQMGDISSHSALLRLLHMYDEMNIQTPLYILNEGEAISI